MFIHSNELSKRRHKFRINNLLIVLIGEIATGKHQFNVMYTDQTLFF